jgi:hypothetical protein
VHTSAGDVVEYAFTRPDDSESLLDHVNFEPLLHFLDAPNIARCALLPKS